MAPAAKKLSKKAATPRDPRIRSRVPLLESMSPELRNLLVGFLDAVLNLERAIEVYRMQAQEPPQKGKKEAQMGDRLPDQLTD